MQAGINSFNRLHFIGQTAASAVGRRGYRLFSQTVAKIAGAGGRLERGIDIETRRVAVSDEA